jgi:hypothetical protein
LRQISSVVLIIMFPCVRGVGPKAQARQAATGKGEGMDWHCGGY